MKNFIITVALVLFCGTISAKETFLLPIKIKSKWGCVNQDAKLVVQPEYDSAAFLKYNHNYIAVCKNNLWGLVDTGANIVLKIQYPYIYSLTSEIVTFLSENYQGNGLIYLNKSLFIPACFGSFSYDRGKIRGDFCETDTTCANFKYGEQDVKLIGTNDSTHIIISNNKVSYIPLRYQLQRGFQPIQDALSNNNVLIGFYGKQGMWNLNTDTISLAPVYDEITGNFLRKGNQWWVVDSVFTPVLSSQQYDTVICYNNCYIVQKGKMQGLFNCDSMKFVIPMQDQQIEFHRDEYNRLIADYVYVTRKTGKGLFYFNGKEFFSCRYKEIIFSSLPAFELVTDRSYSLANKNGTIFFECSHKREDVLMNSYSFYDEHDLYIATPTDFYWYKYNADSSYSLFYKEPARCKISYNESVFDTLTGMYVKKQDTTLKNKIVTPINYADSLRYAKFPGDYQCKKNELGGGVCEKENNTGLINIWSYYRNCELKRLYCFRDTMLYLIKKTTSPEIKNQDSILPNLRYNTHWNQLATNWFDHHTDKGTAYALGIASKVKGELLSPNNKLIMLDDLKQQNCARVMSCEYAFSLINKDVITVRKQLTFIDEPKQGFFRFAENGKLECVADKTFGVKIPYHQLLYSKQLTAITPVGAQWGFMDTDGNDVFAARYDFLSESVGNYSRVYHRGKWGVISILPHSFTIPLKYDSVDYISYKKYYQIFDNYKSRYNRFNLFNQDTVCNQFVKVILKNRVGVCSISTGDKIIAPKYSNVKYFKNNEEGIFAVQDSSGWWLYNEKGKRISNVAYKSVQNMSVPDVVLVVTTDGKKGVFRTSGKLIIEPQEYSNIYFSNGFLVVQQNNSMHYATLTGEWFYKSN